MTEETMLSEKEGIKCIFDESTLKVFRHVTSTDVFYVFRVPPFRPEDNTMLNEKTMEKLTMRLMEELQ